MFKVRGNDGIEEQSQYQDSYSADQAQNSTEIFEDLKIRELILIKIDSLGFIRVLFLVICFLV